VIGVTPTEAASVLGITPHAVRDLARRRSLPGAWRVGRDWWLDPQEVTAFAEARKRKTADQETR
jgi:excisionase family DNA binding protein